MSDAKDHDSVRDAVLRWARAAGVYARYQGVPCAAVRAIGGAAADTRVPVQDLAHAYNEGRWSRPTPYWMGWVAQLLAHDPSARMDMRAPLEELGAFDHSRNYKKGWADARKAAQVILATRRGEGGTGTGGGSCG
jgi:hypothetical protein